MTKAEEILREKFKNTFLDEEYVDLIVSAMEEYASQAYEIGYTNGERDMAKSNGIGTNNPY